MIAPWPPKPRYKTKRLRKAINTTAHADALADFIASTCASTREAIERLQAMRDAIAKAVTDIDRLRGDKTADVMNRRLADIRDDLADAIDESDRA